MLPLLTQLALHPPVALGSADDGPHRRTEDPNVYFWLTTKGPVARTTELGSFKMYLGKGKPPIKDPRLPDGDWIFLSLFFSFAIQILPYDPTRGLEGGDVQQNRLMNKCRFYVLPGSEEAHLYVQTSVSSEARNRFFWKAPCKGWRESEWKFEPVDEKKYAYLKTDLEREYEDFGLVKKLKDALAAAETVQKNIPNNALATHFFDTIA